VEVIVVVVVVALVQAIAGPEEVEAHLFSTKAPIRPEHVRLRSGMAMSPISVASANKARLSPGKPRR
jgi:hypothetical protein